MIQVPFLLVLLQSISAMPSPPADGRNIIDIKGINTQINFDKECTKYTDCMNCTLS